MGAEGQSPKLTTAGAGGWRLDGICWAAQYPRARQLSLLRLCPHVFPSQQEGITHTSTGSPPTDRPPPAEIAAAEICLQEANRPTRAWQHQWRYMRSEKERANRNLPKVDWNRYHLQVSVRRTNKCPEHRYCAGGGRLPSALSFSYDCPQTIMQAHCRSVVSCTCALIRPMRQSPALALGSDSLVCCPDPFCGPHRHSACPRCSRLA